MFVRIVLCGLLLVSLGARPAVAQIDATTETRPALPTTVGDTGLWFLPTAEVLPDGAWSGSIYRSNFDRRQGLTDVSHFAVTAARGFGDHVELFGSWRIVRLSRGTQPFFADADPTFGGVQHEYPYLRRNWSGNLGGPLTVGGKWSFVSQGRGDAMSFATRAMIDFPVGSAWASTGGVTGQFDLIASREFEERIELTGMLGGRLRRDTDEFRLPHGVTWGMGASFPSRAPVRALLEWEGEFVTRDSVQLRTASSMAEDGSLAPVLSRAFDPSNIKLGAVWQSARGFFLHGGANYSFGTGNRTIGGFPVDSHAWGFDVRLGWHGGVRRYIPPPPPEPEVREVIREVPAPPANRPPQFSQAIQCDPCIVEPGQTSRLTAQATDPDGDAVRYQWTAPQGSFKPADAAQTTWTAPNQPGNVPITATAEDGRGGSATAAVTIQVVQRPQVVLEFEDVHFDFDRFNLRPDALKLLDEAVGRLQKNPDVRVTIEGHTDSIGTNEYNLALGERRASSVREYLISRGINANRIETVSFGEERPVADNQTAAGRARNRRASTIVRMQ